MSNDRRNPVYQAALDADARFSKELERAYGPEAADKRYLHHHADAAVAAARAAKVQADHDWLWAR